LVHWAIGACGTARGTGKAVGRTCSACCGSWQRIESSSTGKADTVADGVIAGGYQAAVGTAGVIIARRAFGERLKLVNLILLTKGVVQIPSRVPMYRHLAGEEIANQGGLYS
jgi:hypothetical protein